MRAMAIDYGDVHIGIAVSDLSGCITGEAFTITAYRFEEAVDKIVKAAHERGVERLILGDPRNMDGSYGPRSEKSRKLAKALNEKSGLSVELWDERRTTVDAERILRDSGNFGKNRKKKVNAVAASLILEGYLAKQKHNRKIDGTPERM